MVKDIPRYVLDDEAMMKDLGDVGGAEENVNTVEDQEMGSRRLG
jgi:hypothetical protein